LGALVWEKHQREQAKLLRSGFTICLLERLSAVAKELLSHASNRGPAAASSS